MRMSWLGRAIVISTTLCLLAAPAQADTGLGSPWTGSGPGTATVVSDGSSADPQFSYTLTGREGFRPQTWTFKAVATSATTLSLGYDFTGFHSYYRVVARLESFVTHADAEGRNLLVSAGPTSCCTSPSAGFRYKGRTTLTLQAGDEYGFRITGQHFDRAELLKGRLTLTAANLAPVADDQALAVKGGESLPVMLSATDPEDGAISYAIVAQPLHGTLTGSGSAYTYSPTDGYAGADTFTFHATDPVGATALGRITISVVAPAPCVSDLVLSEARTIGNGIRLAGIADPGLAGIGVNIVEAGSVIASPMIGADGAFSAVASRPPDGSRRVVRYQAQLGALRSRHIRLSRRLITSSARLTGNRVAISGRIAGPARDGKRHLVSLFARRRGCNTPYVLAGRGRAGRDGRYHISAQRPQGQDYVVYRAQTDLPRHGRTFTLPQVVKLG